MFKKFLVLFTLAFFYFVDTTNLPKLEFPRTSAQVLVSPVATVTQTNILITERQEKATSAAALIKLEAKESSKEGDLNGDGEVNSVDRVEVLTAERLAGRVRVLTGKQL